MTRWLLCSDLDRTLLPNGPQPESPQARPRLHALARRPEVTLAYVSGRHRGLLLDAIREFEIPIPQYAVGDVGTTIYEIDGSDWQRWRDWDEEIASDWNGLAHADLERLLSGIGPLRLQEPEKQNTHKLSYYAPSDANREALIEAAEERLTAEGVEASLIWSVDEMTDIGLFDVLPRSATKLHAVRFLMKRLDFAHEQTVFSGDSGNDLPVLTSGLQSVLVRNATDAVRNEAVAALETVDLRERLYLAGGDFLDMNGNYSAGVLEGFAHFVPEAADWIAAAG
ncbi:MAG: HAD-IIB family hydrolase [Chromatiales bacterium]|jgi:hypothetical protein